jgi:hypothetical protein
LVIASSVRRDETEGRWESSNQLIVEAPSNIDRASTLEVAVNSGDAIVVALEVVDERSAIRALEGLRGLAVVACP